MGRDFTRRPQSARLRSRSRQVRRRRAALGLVILVVLVAGSLLGLRATGRLGNGGSIIGGKANAAVTTSGSSPSPQPVLTTSPHLSYRPVKGLYATANVAGDSALLSGLIKIADTTEINAFVIDVKDNSGYVTYNCGAPLATSFGTVQPRIKDIDALIATLTQHNITPIARIVCFQDSVLAMKRPDLAIKSKASGANWRDANGAMYTNPYSREVWEYLVEAAEDAAKHGFREIQFDYVRFPSGAVADIAYPGADSSKEDAIAGFLAFARARLEKLGVWVSADAFGITLQVKNDAGIGQNIAKVAANVDIVCPMIYPSHYAKGSYGFTNPNAHPYDLISDALKDMKAKLAGTGARGRPWLQDFTLGSPAYGVAQVKAEIQAATDQGINEWILWNASNKYTVAALAPK